ncbi:MAG: glycosyltransferase [Nitrospinae bacterium]|nr:glycosyltransferase [Nitrospinota bacterium]
MKVAIIHDWLTGMRGGEKCLEVFCEIFSDADLYTLIHIPGSVSKTIENRNIKTSFIQKLPLARKHYRFFLPLFPLAIERFSLKGYDLILSSSHCVAKGIIPPPDVPHISYIYTPMRYVWDLYQDYFGGEKAGWLSKKAIGILAHYLRMWDVTSSNRVDYFAAISRHVAKRVEKYYRRKAEVIYPPVDCDKFSLSEIPPSPLLTSPFSPPSKGGGMGGGLKGGEGGFYLIISAFAPYKRLDIAIEAFNRTDFKLKIIGDGQDEKRLKGLAKSNIEFLGWQDDNVLREHYAKCKALVFPGEEDFGIVPLEAMASGKPVIAYGKGGALETVIPINQRQEARGKKQEEKPTGVFFYEQTPEGLIEAVKYFEENENRFNKNSIRNHALKFDRAIFKEKIRSYIMEKYEEFYRTKT